jgi:hypothetical protein
MDINDVKQSLAFDRRNMPVIDNRIATLVGKNMTRETQREITTLIIKAVSPKVVVGIIEQFHKQYEYDPTNEAMATPAYGPDGEVLPPVPKVVPFSDTAKYEHAIDIVSLHRLALETLARFVANDKAKQVAGFPCYEYICRVVNELRAEVDVVAVGLKLLSDVMKYLIEDREDLLHLILNCVQAYAPAAAPHRPRNPKRLRSAEEQYADLGAVGGNGNRHGEDASLLGTREAVMPDIDVSLIRYGNFYGRSTPVEKDAAVRASETIKFSGGEKNTDVLERLKTPERRLQTGQAGRGGALQPAVSATGPLPAGGVGITVAAAPPAIEVKALVRGRARVDHSAATSAIQTAFQSSTSKTQSREQHQDPNENDEFLRQQEEFKSKMNIKPPKYKFKFKRKGQSHGDDGVSSGEESDVKKDWKGTIGAIGK